MIQFTDVNIVIEDFCQFKAEFGQCLVYKAFVSGYDQFMFDFKFCIAFIGYL